MRMMIPRNLDISGILEYYSLKIGISILLQTSKVSIKRSAERVTELSYLVSLQYFFGLERVKMFANSNIDQGLARHTHAIGFTI
jgi:hypothetical protein